MSLKPTPRSEKSQRFVRPVNRRFGIVECLTCGAYETVDLDEDGCGAIEQVPCQGDDNCTAMLCGSCDAFRCAICGLLSCNDHKQIVEGEAVCSICAHDVLTEDICIMPQEVA